MRLNNFSGTVDRVKVYPWSIIKLEHDIHIIENLQRLALKNVPGEVFDNDTIVIEIKNELSEN